MQKILSSTTCIMDLQRSYREINYFSKLFPGHLRVINNQQLSDSSDDEEKADGVLTIKKGKHISVYIKLHA